MIGDDTVVDTGSAWHHVYAFPVSAGGDTRVWCEADVIPLNAFRSEKVAASFIEGAALDVLLPIIAAHADARVLMLNVKDGFLPISLPPGAAAQVIGVATTRVPCMPQSGWRPLPVAMTSRWSPTVMCCHCV